MFVNPIWYGVLITLAVELILILILGWISSKNDLDEFDNFD